MSKASKVFLALVSVCFSGCSASTAVTSEGLEDLVACRFDSKAAAESLKGYTIDYRPGLRRNVGMDIVNAFGGELSEYHYRPDPGTFVFGSEAKGIFLWAWHGAFYFSILAKGDWRDVKYKFEKRGVLKLQRTSEPLEHPLKPSFIAHKSDQKTYKNVPSLRIFPDIDKFTTHATLSWDAAADNSIALGCFWTIEDIGHRH